MTNEAKTGYPVTKKLGLFHENERIKDEKPTIDSLAKRLYGK